MNSPLLAVTIVGALSANGVTDVVLAPGSRNAALALALHAADAAGGLRLHVRVDERVAAFLALGLAKASARPVAVITTSGTAVGNLVPAAMEARAAGVGLLVVTADRPSDVVGTGANQTAQQVGAIGSAALEILRVASTSGTPRAWAAAVGRAYALAAGTRTRQPGPVHINVEFSPPLVAAVSSEPITVAQVDASCAAAAAELPSGPRTVVLAGDATPAVGAEARALAEVAGVPLLAEPSSNARAGSSAIAHYRLLLGSALGSQIQRVICFGHPTVSRPTSVLLGRDDVELIVLAGPAWWPDPGHRAAAVHDRVTLAGQDPLWLEQWRAADARLARRRGAAAWDGAGLAAETIAALGPSDNLVLGASAIIRDADLAPVAARPPLVYANRGLSGIDGTVATATGIALATSRPTTVLLGDLTLQHDLGALVRPPLEPDAGLRLVVADDAGAAIFATLEQGDQAYAGAYERVFGTPQGIDLAAVGSALGWRTSVVTSLDQFRRALAEPAAGHFILARLERGTRRERDQALRQLSQNP
ncbi:MAG: 2-succinyl-5-enolpyruvyl-6-hydroxy-3-cyclohexene-1-carboxylic-acid synthase [Arachnia sp.]